MRQCYKTMNLRPASLRMIRQINDIIEEYQAEGYVLTVRQLYYQLVARDIIPNDLRSYKNTAKLVNDGRVAGMIDWDAIEDRTREFITCSRWSSGRSILAGCAEQYHQDMWANQDTRVFVIVEKEALVGVLERTCREYDVPLLAARGYPSVSVIREFCEGPLSDAYANGQEAVILHLGDHDPSGIDMTRDIDERIELFTDGYEVTVHRLALNMDQIKEQRPPPNPAKMTDARFKEYSKKFGVKSWELDALQPDYLSKLVERNIKKYIDKGLWQRTVDEIDEVRAKISKIAEKF